MMNEGLSAPGSPGVHITVKDRILLHLAEHTGAEETVEIPLDLTSEGIARQVWIEDRHVPQYIRPLVKEGLVREAASHVRGSRPRRKTYHLTAPGRLAASRLRQAALAETIRVRDESGSRQTQLAQVMKALGSDVPLLSVLRSIRDTGFIDLTAPPMGSPHGLVEMIAEAPQITGFVGRSAELSSILASGKGPRIFVVRGVAGIGKTSLASKVCAELHGLRNLYWHRVRPWDTLGAVLTSLGEFLRALGRPGLNAVLIRGEFSEAARVLRENLPGTLSLLVFDDAQDGSPDVMHALEMIKEAVAGAPDVCEVVLTRQAVGFYDRRDVEVSRLVREIDLEGLASSEVADLLSDGHLPPQAVQAFTALGGHPLSLELLRSAATPPAVDRARESVLQFLEEEVYSQLTEAERKMMQVASLYRVPVPPNALYAEVPLNHSTLASLVGRALLRRVREGNLEVHDSIREFFTTTLPPEERNRLGDFAVDQLQQLSAAQKSMGQTIACADSLRNAIELAREGRLRSSLQESLGDVLESIGEHPQSLAAYWNAMDEAGDQLALARLHRKAANALEVRGENRRALAEIEKAEQMLGPVPSEEQGWTGLVRCRVSHSLQDWEAAQDSAQSSLDVFESFGIAEGEAQALLELSSMAIHAPGASLALAEPLLARASQLAVTLADPLLRARVELMAGHFYAYHLHRPERTSDAVHSLASLADASKLPQIRLAQLILRGWYEMDFVGNLEAASENFRSALVIANRLYDPGSAADAAVGLAYLAHLQGRYDESRRGFEQYASRLAGLKTRPLIGRLGGRPETKWLIAECCLFVGDLDGFREVMKSFDDPLTAKSVMFPVLSEVLRGIDHLLCGDTDGMRTAFEQGVRIGESHLVEQEAPFAHAHTVHFYYGVSLRALGAEDAAAVHLSRAREILERLRLRAVLAALGQWETRLQEVFRRGY